jgi:acyl-CoA-dependent ceramide synthase
MLSPGDGIWSGYSTHHYPLPGPVKFYYLIETAFYTHGVFILTAEARRKDHLQMMIHHFTAIALMLLSYSWNFTRVGCLIMVLMDVCDVLLPVCFWCIYAPCPLCFRLHFLMHVLRFRRPR